MTGLEYRNQLYQCELALPRQYQVRSHHPNEARVEEYKLMQVWKRRNVFHLPTHSHHIVFSRTHCGTIYPGPDLPASLTPPLIHFFSTSTSFIRLLPLRECQHEPFDRLHFVQESNRICDSSADADKGPSEGDDECPPCFSDDGEGNTGVDANMKSNNVDANIDASSTETVGTDTDGSSVHTLLTTSHIQYYPCPNTRTSTASPSADSASSALPASSESATATLTDVRPPPLINTNDLPALPIEVQLQEPPSLPLVCHRRLCLPEHPHPHIPPQPGKSSQYPTTHRLSTVALSEYTQLRDLRTCVRQLIRFVPS